MNIFSKIKSFFKKPELSEASPHLPERSEGREMNEVQRTTPSSSLTHSAKESFGLIFQDYLKIKTELEVSDVKVNGEGINFKVNYRGSVVPFWLSPDLKVEDALAVIAVGLAIGLNLVEISQFLKNFRTSS